MRPPASPLINLDRSGPVGRDKRSLPPVRAGEPAGIYVKSIVPGSAAQHSGQIRVEDQIVAVSALPWGWGRVGEAEPWIPE